MTEQRISQLSPNDLAALEKQRDWVRGHGAPGSIEYDTVEGKLALLETILATNEIKPDEAWKLQSLGVALGDALAQEMALEWIAVQDEHSRDPALQKPGTTMLMFPLTSISKRVERGEAVDVRALFTSARDTVARIEPKASRRGGFLGWLKPEKE